MMYFLSYFFWDWSLFSWNHYYFGWGSSRLNSCWWSNYRGLRRIISSLPHQFRPILIAIATQLSCWSKPLQGSGGDFHMHVSWLIHIQPVLENLSTFLGVVTFERWGKDRSICHNKQNAVACKQCLPLYELAPVLWNAITARKPKCCHQRLCINCSVLLVEPCKPWSRTTDGVFRIFENKGFLWK